MVQNSFRSASDGNGTYRTANPIANPDFRGPDVFYNDNRNTTNITNYAPCVKVTKATQQALDYDRKAGGCGCK